jgi:hypothetical protein
LGTPDGVDMITADFIDESRTWRHDSHKLAQSVMKLINTPNAKNVME